MEVTAAGAGPAPRRCPRGGRRPPVAHLRFPTGSTPPGPPPPPGCYQRYPLNQGNLASRVSGLPQPWTAPKGARLTSVANRPLQGSPT